MILHLFNKNDGKLLATFCTEDKIYEGEIFNIDITSGSHIISDIQVKTIMCSEVVRYDNSKLQCAFVEVINISDNEGKRM